MRFSDHTPAWNYSVESNPDPTFAIADTSDATLENFFSRPIKIASYSWATGANLFETFNPWQLYFENLRVINRITNFNLLRCKLHVKIVLNGNSFHYGRAIASYNPLHTRDDFTVSRGFFIEDVVAASQRPHIFLDPTMSQGGSLVLPFVWYKNALKIPNQEWREMGDMTIHGMQSLKHANGATDQVIVSVFAWAEEVSLSIPTANEPGALSPQMGEKSGDEYGQGAISRPANMLSHIAGKLKTIPYLAPYARATELAAKGIGAVASVFGYSRPAVLATIEPYKPTYVGNLANTNAPDTCQRLTLDSKQELTVDSRVVGLNGKDELSLATIAQRESYLTTFGWDVATGPESLLWNTEVSPVLWAMRSNEIHMPASCFATLPFRHWRGDIKFRFQVVASAFHRGRLKITYDPSYPLSNEYNTNYTYIIDLAKERDFTVTAGWGQEYSILGHRDPGVDAVPYKTTVLGADPDSHANGILSVYVVNDLTVPNSIANNDIEINVFVSAGDNFQVYNPDERDVEDLVYFVPQVGEVFTPQAEEVGDLMSTDDNAPVSTETDTKLAAQVPVDHTDLVFFGDPIVSFRQCLKRYGYHRALVSDLISSTALNHVSILKNDFPEYRGYAPGASDLTSVPAPSTPYNYSKMTLLNYLTPAFVSRRGSLRWKYVQSGIDYTKNNALLTVTRDPSPSTPGRTETSMLSCAIFSASERAAQMAKLMPHMWSGTTATASSHNPALEVELPFYSTQRFLFGKQANQSAGAGYYHKLEYIVEKTTSEAPMIHALVSIGEDFDLSFFTGAPIAYRVAQTADPTPQV